MATANAVAHAYTWRELIPTSSAESTSCAVARIIDPKRVRCRYSCRPPITATAVASVSAPRAETVIWLEILQLAVVSEPALPPSDLTSGENWRRRMFWIAIESPNVARIGVRMPARRLRSRIVRCST